MPVNEKPSPKETSFKMSRFEENFAVFTPIAQTKDKNAKKGAYQSKSL